MTFFKNCSNCKNSFCNSEFRDTWKGVDWFCENWVYSDLDIELIEISGFTGAMIGMRLPFNSTNDTDLKNVKNTLKLGPKDLSLLGKLSKAGRSHRKTLRMMHVQLKVRAPRYWWIEADTYKIATVTNSESTMHTIAKKPFSRSDFALGEEKPDEFEDSVIARLNKLREDYEKTDDAELKKKIWQKLIRLLPQSYKQTRIWDLNYETLITIYDQRRMHKLEEWRHFCRQIEELPYMKEILEATELKKPVDPNMEEFQITCPNCTAGIRFRLINAVRLYPNRPKIVDVVKCENCGKLIEVGDINGLYEQKMVKVHKDSY